MDNINISKIIITSLLIVGILVNSSFAAVCLCGQACSHGLQRKNSMEFKLFFHLQCSGTQCKSCDLEKGKSITATNPLGKNYNAKNFDATITLPAHIYCPSAHHTFRELNSFCVLKTTASPPIYLQNLCLRC
jgi:hypothetical protein